MNIDKSILLHACDVSSPTPSVVKMMAISRFQLHIILHWLS